MSGKRAVQRDILMRQAHEISGKAKGAYAEAKGDAKSALADVKDKMK